jgi:hypothetical protein
MATAAVSQPRRKPFREDSVVSRFGQLALGCGVLAKGCNLVSTRAAAIARVRSVRQRGRHSPMESAFGANVCSPIVVLRAQYWPARTLHRTISAIYARPLKRYTALAPAATHERWRDSQVVRANQGGRWTQTLDAGRVCMFCRISPAALQLKNQNPQFWTSGSATYLCF